VTKDGWPASSSSSAQHDDAFDVRRDALGRLRPARIRRKGVERRGRGDADEVCAELLGAPFHRRGVEHGHARKPGAALPEREPETIAPPSPAASVSPHFKGVLGLPAKLF
jgi:hypothetical protein